MITRLIFSFLLLSGFCNAQADDSLVTRQWYTDSNAIQLRKAFIINYDNDFFVQTDYYYTQGSYFELDLPGLIKDPLSKVLLHTRTGEDEYFGITYGQQGFTPTSILSDTILRGDRPFAGTFYFGIDRSSCDRQNQIRVKSELDLGVIGPWALGYESQKFIHEHTNNPIPHGWEHQIANDAMVNYSLVAEKALLHWRPYDPWKVRHDHLDLIGYAMMNAGTVYTNGGLGLFIRTGFMNDYMNAADHSRKVEFYIFGRGEAHIIGYNATLQGGLFNTTSEYIIRKSAVERTVFSGSAGVAFSFRKIHVEFAETGLTPEFAGQRKHAWGHIELAFGL